MYGLENPIKSTINVDTVICKIFVVWVLSKDRFVFIEDTEQQKSLYDIISLYNNTYLIIIEGFMGIDLRR